MFSISSTPDRLEIRHLPMYRWYFGVFFTIIALMFIFGSRANTIECTRGVECRFTRSLLIGGSERVFAVDELRGAHAQVTRGDRGRYSYRVYLNIAGESVFMYTEDGRESQDDVTRAVNAFVNNSHQATLRAVKDDRPFGIAVGLSFLLISALASLVFAPIVYASFDARTGQFTIRRRTLFRDSNELYPLDEVQGAEVKVTDWNIRDLRYRVIFVMTGGNRIGMTTFPSYFRKPKDKVVRAVQQFLTTARQSGWR